MKLKIKTENQFEYKLIITSTEKEMGAIWAHVQSNGFPIPN